MSIMYLSSQKTARVICKLKNLTFNYQNIHGINIKLAVFNRNIVLCDYDVIVLPETWLHNGINDNELGLLPNYSILCCDRGRLVFGNNARGGGALIAVKSYFHFNVVLLQNNNIDQLFVKLTIGSFILLIASVYNPSHSDIKTYNINTDTVNNLLIRYCYSKIIL